MSDITGKHEQSEQHYNKHEKHIMSSEQHYSKHEQNATIAHKKRTIM